MVIFMLDFCSCIFRKMSNSFSSLMKLCHAATGNTGQNLVTRLQISGQADVECSPGLVWCSRPFTKR